MYNRTLPDFKVIASHVVDKHEVAELLEEIYKQGYYAGRFDQEQEWWLSQDASLEEYTEKAQDEEKS